MPKTLHTREQWLEKGLISFGRDGLPGLSVEKMAEELGCSKSSFYWYFKTKESFLQNLIQYWNERETLTFIRNAEKEATPAGKFRGLFLRAGKADLRMDFLFHLRNLAKKDRKIRNLLNQIESLRIEFVQGLLEDMGETKEHAREKAEFIYCHALGWYERQKSEPPAKRDVELAILSACRLLRINL